MKGICSGVFLKRWLIWVFVFVNSFGWLPQQPDVWAILVQRDQG